jgi:hypothetical protein
MGDECWSLEVGAKDIEVESLAMLLYASLGLGTVGSACLADIFPQAILYCQQICSFTPTPSGYIAPST